MELKLTDWTHSGAGHLSDVMFYLLVHEENEVKPIVDIFDFHVCH